MVALSGGKKKTQQKGLGKNWQKQTKGEGRRGKKDKGGKKTRSKVTVVKRRD